MPFSLSTLGFGAAATAAIAFFGQIKSFFQRLVGILVITVEVKGRVYDASQAYCWNNLKPAWTPFRHYIGRVRFVRPLNRYASVAYEVLGPKVRVFWKGWKPLWIKSPTPTSSQAEAVTFFFIRGTFSADKLVHEIMQYQVNNNEREVTLNRFKVVRKHGRSSKDAFGMSQKIGDSGGGSAETISATSVFQSDYIEGRLVGWADEEIGEVEPTDDPLSRIALTPEAKSAVNEVVMWYHSKEWYNKRHIPWRRGVLLEGPPGTGKSSLTKALAKHLNMPVYSFDISTMDNQEFYDAWQSVLTDTPAIALIEDIDTVFNGRENIVSDKGKGLSFDCLLNTISGVEAVDGVLLVITTNNLNAIDSALGLPLEADVSVSSRPGRIDKVVHLPALDEAGRYLIANRILFETHSPEAIAQVVDHCVGYTGAQFEEKCAMLALAEYWKSKEGEVHV